MNIRIKRRDGITIDVEDVNVLDDTGFPRRNLEVHEPLEAVRLVDPKSHDDDDDDDIREFKFRQFTCDLIHFDPGAGLIIYRER